MCPVISTAFSNQKNLIPSGYQVQVHLAILAFQVQQLNTIKFFDGLGRGKSS